MRWKATVLIKRKDKQTNLYMGQKQMKVKEEDLYLVHAIEKGICEENTLAELVMEHEHVNEMVAGFTLAHFILAYQDYLEEDKEYYEITP